MATVTRSRSEVLASKSVASCAAVATDAALDVKAYQIIGIDKATGEEHVLEPVMVGKAAEVYCESFNHMSRTIRAEARPFKLPNLANVVCEVQKV